MGATTGAVPDPDHEAHAAELEQVRAYRAAIADWTRAYRGKPGAAAEAELRRWSRAYFFGREEAPQASERERVAA